MLQETFFEATLAASPCLSRPRAVSNRSVSLDPGEDGGRNMLRCLRSGPDAGGDEGTFLPLLPASRPAGG